MFAIFAVLGWACVIIGAVAVAGFTGFGMYLSNSIDGIAKKMVGGTATLSDATSMASLQKMAGNGIVKFLNTDVYGDNKIIQTFFGTPGSMNMFQLWIWPIIVLCSQAFLIFIAAVELHRLRKSQMVSKPFVKIIVVTTMALDLILGKMISVVGGVALFTGLVFLEMILFNHHAVQNYSEEQNLAAISKDEKRFEKESRKSGVDHDTFNPLEIGSPDMPAADTEIKYSEIPDGVTDPGSINNKKYRKYYIQWQMLKEQLDKFRVECYEKAQAGLNERNRFKLQSKFNERAEKINIIAKELKLVDSFKEPYIDLTDANGNTFPQQGTLQSSGALHQAMSAFGKKGDSSTDYDPNIENIYNTNSSAADGFKAPNFSPVSEAPMPGGRPETFAAPVTTSTEAFQKRRVREKELMRVALERAVRMDWSMLPETSGQPNFTIEQLTNDIGVHAETKDISFGSGQTQSMNNAPTPAPEYSNDAPRFDTKVTEPPKFGGDSFDEAPTFTAPSGGGESRPETFVMPQTVATSDLQARKERDKQFMQAALARAVRMDWNMIPAANGEPNASIHDVENELGLHVETKDASFNTTQIRQMLNAETAILEAPQTEIHQAPVAPSFGSAPSAPQHMAAEPTHIHAAPSFGGMPASEPAPSMGMPSAPMQQPQMAAMEAVTQMQQAAPSNNNGGENVKIDQIEKRMENIEKMIQSLSLAQNYQAPNSNIDNEKVGKLKDEFSKIEEQLSRISQTFDITGNEPKNLFGALIRGYKYNNKK